MVHNFDVEIAVKYGILEAVIINHLEDLITNNEVKGENYYDGRYWLYNPINELVQLMPYATENSIRYTLKKLKDKGIITIGHYSKSKYDRTMWCAFTNNL